MSGAPQDRVAVFCARHKLEMSPEARFIDLTSEVGELGKALLKAGSYGATPPAPTEEMLLEAGDCLFSLLAFCSATGLDADQALTAALNKYARRYAERGEIGSRA